MIKNVVFDIGKVLADYRLVEFLAAKGFDGAMIKRIIKTSIMSPYWDMFERADITEDEAFQGFASLDPEIADQIYAAYSNISGMLTASDHAIPWLLDLKQRGYGVYYLSNYSSKGYYECADSLSFMEHMDGGCLSFQEHLTKPDPAFYQVFLERYGLNAEECVFVDDTPENVEVAKSLGFQGVVFETYENAAQLLDQLLEA